MSNPVPPPSSPPPGVLQTERTIQNTRLVRDHLLLLSAGFTLRLTTSYRDPVQSCRCQSQIQGQIRAGCSRIVILLLKPTSFCYQGVGPDVFVQGNTCLVSRTRLAIYNQFGIQAPPVPHITSQGPNRAVLFKSDAPSQAWCQSSTFPIAPEGSTATAAANSRPQSTSANLLLIDLYFYSTHVRSAIGGSNADHTLSFRYSRGQVTQGLSQSSCDPLPTRSSAIQHTSRHSGRALSLPVNLCDAMNSSSLPLPPANAGGPIAIPRQQVSIERLPTRRQSNEPRESMNCKSCRKRKVRNHHLDLNINEKPQIILYSPPHVC